MPDTWRPPIAKPAWDDGDPLSWPRAKGRRDGRLWGGDPRAAIKAGMGARLSPAMARAELARLFVEIPTERRPWTIGGQAIKGSDRRQTHLDALRASIAAIDGGGHSEAWVEAMLQADIAHMVARLLAERRELCGDRVQAAAIVNRWLAAPV